MIRLTLTVAGLELRNQLRDSTVLAMAILFPLLVLPLSLWLSLAVGQLVTGDLEKNPPRVAASGPAEDLALVFEDSDLIQVEPTDSDPGAAVLARRIDAAIHIEASGEARVATLHLDSNSARSLAAKGALTARLDALRDRRIDALAERHGLDGARLRPRTIAQDAADDERTHRDIRRYFGAGVAYFLLMMCGFGLFYPAVEIVVGERERGTLETTLAAGVPRAALLAGKLLAVLAIALFSGLSGCAALALSLTNVAQLAAQKSASAILDELNLSITPDPSALVVVPLATLSFLALTTALLVLSMLPARTFKSAQNLGTLPLYLALFLPMGGVLPLPLDAATALVPLLNCSLMIRDVFAADAQPWGAIALSLGVNGALTAAIFAFTLRIFMDERFLFGGWLPGWMIKLIGTEGAS